MTSRAGGKVLRCGRLETPSLAELRERVRDVPAGKRIAVREVVADVQALHADAANAGTLFQVASQFNLLEMTSPDPTPEEGHAIALLPLGQFSGGILGRTRWGSRAVYAFRATHYRSSKIFADPVPAFAPSR